MARKYSSHSSSLFLLELILAILFFSVAAAVCVQLFVKSHLLSKEAQFLSHAVNECSDAAEIILSADTYEEVVSRLTKAYPEAVLEEQQLTVNFDETYQTVISYTMEGKMLTADISFEDPSSEEAIYELNIEHFLQEERNEH